MKIRIGWSTTIGVSRSFFKIKKMYRNRMWKISRIYLQRSITCMGINKTEIILRWTIAVSTIWYKNWIIKMLLQRLINLAHKDIPVMKKIEFKHYAMELTIKGSLLIIDFISLTEIFRNKYVNKDWWHLLIKVKKWAT